MMPNVDRVLPTARACRNRRTMFSTSMIASSTTTPMATTSPASTITLSVAPARSRTSIAATRDSGMAIRLMKAVRHSNSRLAMINTTRPMPISMAVVRLSIDCSMNVAGRKIVVSIAMPGRPGFISSIACSTPRVTSIVLAPRYFCTTSKRPVAVVDHGVADQRSGIDEHVAQIAQPHDPAVPLGDRHLRELVRIR